ncbi:aminotransferase class V-fold PLP-dependent enzyme [Halorubellus litoreus]|uniref:Aminotransferase class V-fold PLP-dependent enzyme n=1 Tax=Halorubellus litoreus TaxID=755308 RepID=A0ABD5VH00_9EURY
MDTAELRESIPAVEAATYLNTGASGPSPRPVVDAAVDALREHAYRAPAEDGMYAFGERVFDAAREAVADHLGTVPGNVALTNSTGDGLARIAAAVDWAPGDVVVRLDHEHAANVLPWARLEREADVEVRVVETHGGRVDRGAFADAVADARLVAFSSLCWTNGVHLDVPELTAIAQASGTRVVVDAVQSVGQHAVDVTEWGADAVVASGHKWLLGDWGSGFVYVDPGFADELHPAVLGYFGVEYPPTADYDLKSGAQRFETGTRSVAPYAALTEAIATIEAVGIDTIEAEIERLTDHLKAAVPVDALHSPPPFESGLVALSVDDPAATVARLAANDVHVKTVPGPRGELVRVSLHAFNTIHDVNQLLAAL